MNKLTGYTLAIVAPIILLAVITPWSAEIDLWASRYFFEGKQFSSNLLADVLYRFAIIPAWILSLGSLAVWIGSYFIKSLQKWRKASLYLVLTLAIGSGLIVHGILKEGWGRARPKETIEFGGIHPFRAYYQPNFTDRTEPLRSFACGHCTTGFYFFSLMWLGYYYKKKWLFWFGLLTALGLGGLLSWARILQGGHFFTDTLVAAIIMWLTAFILYLLFYEKRKI